MIGRRFSLAALSHFLHRHFLWLLIGAYAAAGVVPAPGLWLGGVSLGEVSLLGETARIGLPAALLAVLLANAGLGLRTGQLRRLASGPWVLVAGLAANLLLPVAFVLGVTRAMVWWHNPEEVQQILVGLALVASMPVAGSSTAWAQNAGGNLALSLGLVLFSTLLSPLTTPATLHAAGLMAEGDYAARLHELATSGTSLFLGVCVALPSLAGLLVRGAVGEARVTAARPALTLINSLVLLVLSYSNASVSLPQTVADPDWDFLAAMLVIVVGLCAATFTAGAWIGRALKADSAQRAALMFGLGMNNNGTGLVLASAALAAHPRVMLPIIFYTLVQHLVAAVADGLVCSRRGPERASDEEQGQPSSAAGRPQGHEDVAIAVPVGGEDRLARPGDAQ
jgi:bile acid:Na+ symporter, BASS family